MNKFIIDEQLLTALGQHFASRPWSEANPFIAKLQEVAQTPYEDKKDKPK